MLQKSEGSSVDGDRERDVALTDEVNYCNGEEQKQSLTVQMITS